MIDASKFGLNREIRDEHRFSNDTTLIVGEFTKFQCISTARALISVDTSLNFHDGTPKNHEGVYCVAQDEKSLEVYYGGRLKIGSNVQKIGSNQFNPYLDGVVYELSVRDSKLYVEGRFSQVNKQNFPRRAVFSDEGVLDPELSHKFQNESGPFTLRENEKLYSALGLKDHLMREIAKKFAIEVTRIYAGFDNLIYVIGPFYGVGGRKCSGALIVNDAGEIVNDFAQPDLQDSHTVACGPNNKAQLSLVFESQSSATVVYFSPDGKIDRVQNEKLGYTKDGPDVFDVEALGLKRW